MIFLPGQKMLKDQYKLFTDVGIVTLYISTSSLSLFKWEDLMRFGFLNELQAKAAAAGS